MDKPPASSESSSLSACGSSESLTSQITLNISTTTGGNFPVVVNLHNCVDTLRKLISKKLKVPKDRICLLHRQRELQEGTLTANGLQDGSKILLIPNVETGLLAQRPENTVMQALESLNDSQVNDFLTGKTPLNLSMRLGDHMMLIQLQLSTINSAAHTSPRSSLPTNQASIIQFKNATLDKNNHNISVNMDNIPISKQSKAPNISSSPDVQDLNNLIYDETNMNSFLIKKDFENLGNIVQNLTTVENATLFAETTNSTAKKYMDESKPILNNIDESKNITCSSKTNETNTVQTITLLEQSPIKSLSHLVSTSIKNTSDKQINNTFPKVNSSNADIDFTDPISAKLTSCLCKHLNSSNKKQNCEYNNCKTCYSTEVSISGKNENTTRDHSSSSILHKIANNTIKNKYQHGPTSNIMRKSAVNLSESKNRGIFGNLKAAACATSSKEKDFKVEPIEEQQRLPVNETGKRTLAEASRNLTQTLRKLSKEVFTNKMDFSEERSRTNSSGAVIESMRNHGKGIYSGTFSGTLNPNLQDRYGRPKRDISTVIHILNDLLSATPHYTRATRISFETPSSSRTNKQVSTRNQSTSTTDVCVKCLNSIKVAKSPYCELQDHNNVLPTTGHKNGPECNSSLCLCSHQQSLNINQISGTKISNVLNNTSSISDLFDNVATSAEVGKLSETYESNSDKSFCNKCTFELENNKTKCKLEQLKVVMQQRKQRREARKLKDTPYGGRVSSTTLTNIPQPTSTVITTLSKPNDVSSKHLGEEVDTAA